MFIWILNTPFDTFSKLLIQVAVAFWKLRAPPLPTLNYTISSPPFPSNKSRRYKNQFFFNPVTPTSWITTCDISKSPQVRFLIVWSSLNYLTVHQPEVTNSMYFHPTYIPHLQHLQSETHFKSSHASAVVTFFAKIVNLLRLLAVFAEVPHRGYLTGF